MPRGTSTLILFFAWGLKHMLAGLVMMSGLMGLLVMAAAFALSVPMWIALALYPVSCSLTLLFMATIMNFRSTRPASGGPLVRQQA